MLPKHAKSVVPCRAVPYLCAYLLMTTHSILAFMETQRGVHGTCMMLQPDACVLCPCSAILYHASSHGLLPQRQVASIAA